jgi:hypothetical protein
VALFACLALFRHQPACQLFCKRIQLARPVQRLNLRLNKARAPSRQICLANRLPGDGRGDCWERAIEDAIDSSPMPSAVAESFFSLLKHERIRRRKYKTREKLVRTCSTTSSFSATHSENT